ncbi:hypothetical protein ACO0QE_000193 [Hanseniaspora vineae]
MNKISCYSIFRYRSDRTAVSAEIQNLEQEAHGGSTIDGHAADTQENQQREKHSEKCSKYFHKLYRQNPEWNYDDIKYFFNDDTVDDQLLAEMMETARVYFGCYFGTEKDESFKDAFPDLESRIFPFLHPNFTTGLSDFTPTIIKYSFQKDELDLESSIIMEELPFEETSGILSLLSSSAYSQGDGVVLTMGQNHLDILPRFLNVLKYLQTNSPIQIVLKSLELEFPDPEKRVRLMEILHQYNVENGLDIEILDCSKLLNPDFIQSNIINVLNKWIAMIFNGFENFLLLDIDVVIFEKPEFFFQLSDFQNEKTSMIVFKDRHLVEEKTYSYCISMFKKLLPKNFDRVTLKEENPELNYIFEKFFDDGMLHSVDSGLVVVKKLKALPQLLTAMQLNVGGKPIRCVYGDKEFTWLSYLILGDTTPETIKVIPFYGGIAGRASEPQEIGQETLVEVCGTQLAHVNPFTNKLLWVNGGLKTCKMGKEAAEKDFTEHYDYFNEKFGEIDENSSNEKTLTLEQLQKVYDNPLRIDTIVIPDTTSPLKKWYQGGECLQYSYCAVSNTTSSASLGAQVNLGEGLYVNLTKNQEQLQYVNEISLQWNQRAL